MKKLILICLVVTGSALGATRPAPAPANSGPATNYSDFNLIVERNIFNSRRSARYVPSSEPRSAPRRRSESFALVGTMDYDKGLLAFFDGSSSEFRKVLKTNDSIAGFKITQVLSDSVELTAGTNQQELHFGSQMRKDDSGWKLVDQPFVSSVPSVASSYSRPAFVTQTNIVTRTNTVEVEGAPSFSEFALPEGIDPAAAAAAAETFRQRYGVIGSSGDSAVRVAPAPSAAPSSAGGGESDILERLRQRAAAERGENP